MRLTQAPDTAVTRLEVDPLLDTEIRDSTDPLVVQMKNTDRLERLRVNLRAQMSLQLKTSPIARVMRRDWNIVSVKLFLNALDERQKNRISQDLTELHWQACDLLDSLKPLTMPEAQLLWMRPRLLEVRVVHPLAAQWLRSMRVIDESYLIMINAEKSGLITRRRRWAMVAPMQLAYMGFKASAMGLPLKTSMELLEAAGL